MQCPDLGIKAVLGGVVVLTEEAVLGRFGDTSRMGGMGKGNDQQPMDSAQARTVVLEATIFLFALPIRCAISSTSFNSASIAPGVPARPWVWGTRIVGETLGCHGCFAFRCLEQKHDFIA